MDIISYAKASQTLKGAKKYDAVTVAPGAEDRFETVDERIDYLENKLVGRYEDKVVEIDLKDGTFTNTELNENGELQLKVIGLGKVLSGSYTPNGTAILKGLKVSGESSHSSYNTDKMFDNKLTDDSTSRFIGADINGSAQIIFENPTPIPLTKYSWVSRNDVTMPSTWKMEGSNDKQSWEVIDERKNIDKSPTGWREFVPKTIKTFKYHRWNIISKYDDSYAQGVNIYEMKMFSDKVRNFTYVSKGTWESNIIDLGGEWIETKYLKFTQDVAESHSITKEISYSDDGITFSDYELYDVELVGQHRFIKVRLELTSTDEISDTTNYSYEAEGNKDFTFNKDSVIQTDRIVLNTNKKVNATSIKEGYYETDLTGFNRISKVKEVF